MSICQLEVITHLTASMEEEAQGLVREVAVLHAQDDQMSDSILDRDWVSELFINILYELAIIE